MELIPLIQPNSRRQSSVLSSELGSNLWFLPSLSRFWSLLYQLFFKLYSGFLLVFILPQASGLVSPKLTLSWRLKSAHDNLRPSLQINGLTGDRRMDDGRQLDRQMFFVM